MDTLEGCSHTPSINFTYENALMYVDKDVLHHFLGEYHVIDQYGYVNDLILNEYGDVLYSTPFFCEACHKLEMVFYFSDRVDFYVCSDFWCHSEFCGECTEKRDCVVYREPKSYHRSLYYVCLCNKHDTLYEALYSIVFIDAYYEK
jgi:hypothetical protein